MNHGTVDEIHNPRTGQRMRFLPVENDVLRIETVNPPAGEAEPVHVHPRQESSVELVSGSLRFVVDGSEHRLGPGDALTIPAGVPHNFVNDGDVDAVAIQAFSPALRTEAFFRVWFDLSRRGEIGESGMPSLLRLAVLAPEFGDEIRVARPPWFVQRTVFALLAPVARLRGYRAAPAPRTAPVYARAARRASRRA